MRFYSSWLVFLLLVALAAVFVTVSSLSLPSTVGSHFTVGGSADGFMSRDAYRGLMVGVVVGVPLLMALVSDIVRVLPSRFVNLPNRDYWLGPERKTETIAYLSHQGRVFGLLIAGLLCYIHWLVVLANRQHPPHFPESPFAGGFVTFIVAVAVWLVMFIVHFRRRV